MIGYTDYVDPAKAGESYEKTDEFFRDVFSYLDMFLEESRNVRDRVNSEGFYDIPPCLRRAGGESVLLETETKRMTEYIMSRQEFYRYPLTFLFDLLQLSLYEKLAVLAALAVEYDERYSGIYSGILEKKTERPTIGLVNRLYRLVGGEPLPEQNAISDPEGRMGQLFFDMYGEEGIPIPEKKLRLYSDMVDFLLGDVRLEEYLVKLTRDKLLTRDHEKLFGKSVLVGTADRISRIREIFPETRTVLLSGQGTLVKRTVARLVASRNGSSKEGNALVINSDYMEGLTGEAKIQYLHKIRFAALGTDVILLCGLSPEKLQKPGITLMIMKLRASIPDSLLLVDIGDADDRNLRTLTESPAFAGAQVVKIEPTDLDGRAQMWKETLEGCELDDDVDSLELAEGYRLSYDEIINIASGLSENAKILGKKIDRKTVRTAINDACSASFGTLAERLRTDYTWDDICIEEAQKKVLMMACDRYMHRNRVCRDLGIGSGGAYGNGVSVLLYGPPGTGKTMAAQIVANEVGLPLFRVDLSQLSSKYIGETQKNLSKVFDEAAKTNVILFFDEADSVFAKRTEVDSSNDKYSNSDSAFLLQKLEGYSGFVILATNLYNNFDNAFVRRITYACSLISPDEKTRIAIFNTSLPKNVKTDGKLDLDYFGSKFELSGSNIRSIVTSAVYLAEIEGKPLSNRHLTISLCYEFRKIGKMVPISDLGPYGIYVKETM